MTDDFYCDEVFSGKTPVNKILETDNVLAYYHTKPHWPVHIVVVPKEHIESLLTISDSPLVIEILEVIKQVAKKVNNEHGSCRILTNLGKYQDSKHLHFHVCYGDPSP
ncbi:MAG: HIT domain-containing protein [Nanoarchaeota archaeon]